MITEREFISAPRRFGYEYFTGVPCSSLAGIHQLIDSDPRLCYTRAPNEGARAATSLTRSDAIAFILDALPDGLIFYLQPARPDGPP